MTTALFSLCSMTIVVSAISGRTNTFCILPHNGLLSLMETHRNCWTSRKPRFITWFSWLGGTAGIFAAGTLLFWKNRWAGSFWFGIVLIRSYCLISLTYWWLGMSSRLSPSFVLSGSQLSQWSCPDVKHKKRKRNQNLILLCFLRADKSKRSGISSATEREGWHSCEASPDAGLHMLNLTEFSTNYTYRCK